MLLSEEDAAKAEAMILPDLPGKTYGQVEKLVRCGGLIAMWGPRVDWPFVENTGATEWLAHAPICEEDKAKIFGGNAKRLLRM